MSVYLAGSTFTNDGSVTGGAAIGFNFFLGGTGVAATNSTLTNHATIIGGYGFIAGDGITLTSSSLTNTGVIDRGSGGHGGTGVYVTTSVLINTGSIAGGNDALHTNGRIGGVGVLFLGGGTLTDSGEISGGTGTSGLVDAINFGTGTARLILDPGVAFVGNVVADGSSTTLELASAAGAGTITGIGTSFSGFGSIVADADATWVVTGSVTGIGTVSLGAGSRLTFDAGVAVAMPVDFIAATGTLGLRDSADFAATAFGLRPGDAIDFTTISSAGSIITGVNPTNALTLTSNGVLLAEIKLDPPQDFSDATFQAAPDGGMGTVVTETQPICFLAGTMIATPGGETPIEQLRVGDMVLTARGASRPVIWIGTGQVLATRGRRSATTPVAVRKGALADNVPHCDLRITKAHALCCDAVLIPGEFLINHRSIHWDDRAQGVALYHVELETHDVLGANCAPAESYRDDGNRGLFRNANSGWGLQLPLPCAPVLTGGPIVDAARRRLLDRACARPGLPLTDEPDLHLLADGQQVDGWHGPDGHHVFDLPRRPRDLRLISRASAPVELGLTREPRVLGVAVRQVRLWQGTKLRLLETVDAALAEGFHAFEPDILWRWTDGDAALPATLFADIEGSCQLELLVGGAMRYSLFEEAGRQTAA